MQLKRLTLTHLRAFTQAELSFQPGMNLIVGINGVGKSTILDALRILLSQAITQLSNSRKKSLEFHDSDITITQDAITAELAFEIENIPFNYLVHQPRSQYITVQKQAGETQAQTFQAVEHHDLTSSKKAVSKATKQSIQQPLALYFSPRRALPTHSKGDPTSAFANALDHRELRLIEFAEWWLTQKTLAEENKPLAQRHLTALAEAATAILETCSNVRAESETFTYQDKKGNQTQKKETTLLIDKNNTTLDISQLSDGERGILALVLDLARRLSQANPNLTNPLTGKAVVLIDELGLHLHPRWQRTIVQKLTNTFPNCQFIATTHSPLVIGEVEPEKIILLEADQPPFRPDQALGMDTDWILKYLMGTTTRNIPTEQTLKRIAQLIETENYDQASDAIDTLRDSIGEFPELVRLQARIDRFQLLAE